MALVLKDRVKQAAAAPGTGTITLGATPTGFQSFAAVGNGNTTYFAIVDSTSGDWEVNYGVYTSSGTTLTRNSPPLSSSNAGALTNFTGAVDVFLTYPSENAVWRDTSGVVVQQSFGAITAASAALTTGTVSTTPASNTDIANKLYVDGLVTQGISYHEPVYVESPNTAGNLTATYNNGASGVGATLTNNGTKAALTIDGILMTTTKRVLIYNQTNAYENGVYTVTTVGTPDPGGTNWVLTRSTDTDTYGLRDPNALGYNDAFFVTNGDTGAGETYVCTTTGVITFGTTNITFAQISSAQVYTAGTGLNLSPATTFNISNTGVTANTYGSASAVPVITVNAQGQATGVTNTSIAINGTQVSGNITGSAGSVANALTLGSYLTGGSFNGSAAVTATVDATSANTASKVVARDASGDFSAGTITATLNGTSTSTTTATNLAGGTLYQIPYQTAAGTTSFITAASGTNTVLNFNGSAFSWSAGTISGVPLGSNLNSLTAGTYLTGTAYNGSAALTWTVDATSANTASKVVARDASGDFSAGTITAALNGNASSATSAPNYLPLAGGTMTGPLYSPQYDNGSRLMFNSPSTYYLGLVGNVTTGGGSLSMVQYNSPNGSAAAAINSYPLLHSANYNSYAPTLTGTGASGTWGINVTGSSGSTSGNAATASRVTGGNLNPASTAFNNALISASSSNRVVTFDGNGYTPSVWWSNGSRAYGAIDAIDPGLAFWANNGTSWQQQMQVNYGNVTINTDIRSPIFYDSNNTGYYLDPASTSNLNQVNLQGILRRNASASGYLEGNYPTSTDANSSSCIYTIGGAYQPGTTSLGNMYGCGYTLGNGTANPGLGQTGWGLYVASDGVSRIFLNSDAGVVISSGSTRSPIFYDSDNTGYYVDPASTSDTALRMRGGALFGPNTTWGAYLAVGGNGWYGGGSYASVAATDGNLHIDAATGKDIYLNYYAGSNVRAYSSFIAVNNVSSPIYYDYNNSAYYGDFAGTTNLYTLGVNSYIDISAGIYMRNQQYILNTAANGWNTVIDRNGGDAWIVYGGNSVRAPLFYDSNNTGYYVDPAGTSNLNAGTCYGIWQYVSNQNTTGANPPLQAYSTGNNGAIMSFHKGGYYAVNMGLDSDNVFRIGGWSAPANVLQLDMSGNLTMLANVTAYSDERLKKDWDDLPSDFVSRLAHVKSGTYTRIDNEMRQIGVGAQSLQPLMNEAVFENEDGTLSVAYGNAAMASSVELAKYVTALEQRISQLEARL